MPTVIGDTSPTPVRQTRDQLVTQVLRYVKAPSHAELTTLAQDELNNAIRRLNARTWYWSLESDDITLVAGTDAYTIAGTYKAARVAELLNGSGLYVGRLAYYEPQAFDEWVRDSTGAARSDPDAYTVFNYNDSLQLTLTCAPTAAFVTSYPTLRFRYMTRINVFTSNGNFTGPSEAEEFILWYARHVVALHTDPSLADNALQQSERVWSLLIRDDMRHHNTDWGF